MFPFAGAVAEGVGLSLTESVHRIRQGGEDLSEGLGSELSFARGDWLPCPLILSHLPRPGRPTTLQVSSSQLLASSQSALFGDSGHDFPAALSLFRPAALSIVVRAERVA